MTYDSKRVEVTNIDPSNYPKSCLHKCNARVVNTYGCPDVWPCADATKPLLNYHNQLGTGFWANCEKGFIRKNCTTPRMDATATDATHVANKIINILDRRCSPPSKSYPATQPHENCRNENNFINVICHGGIKHERVEHDEGKLPYFMLHSPVFVNWNAIFIKHTRVYLHLHLYLYLCVCRVTCIRQIQKCPLAASAAH